MNKLAVGQIIAGIILLVVIIIGLTQDNELPEEIEKQEPTVEEPKFQVTINQLRELIPNFDKIINDSKFIIYTNLDGNILAYNTKTNEVDFSGTDATTIIENAMNSLDFNRKHKQMVTIIGNYIVTSTIDIPSYTTLQLIGNLKAKNYLSSTMIQNSDDVNGNRDIEIFGGLINGNKANQDKQKISKHTIKIKNVDNFHIHDTEIINGWTSALRTSFSNNVVIENNIIDNSADDGIAINEETAFAIVRGNIIINSGQNETKFGAPNGIEIQDGAHDVIVTNNTVINTLNTGIEVSTHPTSRIFFPSAPFNVVIVGNTIIGANHNGITFDGEPNLILLNSTAYNNTIFDAGSTGIMINFGKNILVNDNFISSSGGRGIIISQLGSGFNTISHNFITSSQKDGIKIEETSTNDNIYGNSVIDNGQSLSGAWSGIFIKGNNTKVKNNFLGETRTDLERTQKFGLFVDSKADSTVVIRNQFFNNIQIAQIKDLGTNSTLQDNIFLKTFDNKKWKSSDGFNNFTNNQNFLSRWINIFGSDFNMKKVLDGLSEFLPIQKNE